MKTKNALCGISMTVALQLGMLAGSAQTNKYLFAGSETNITLPPGTYIITAYGAKGINSGYATGGLGAEMSAKFYFSTNTMLTLLVGGSGNNQGYCGGGGGGSFVFNGTNVLVIAGGGGGGGGANGYIGGSGLTSTNGGGSAQPNGGSGGIGGSAGGSGSGSSAGGGGSGFQVFFSGGGGYSGYGQAGYGGGGLGISGAGGGGGYSGGGGGAGFGGGVYNVGSGGGGGSIIDASATSVLTQVSGIASPDGAPNGEIIITTVSAVLPPAPPAVGITTVGNLPVVVWPVAGTNFVLQMSTNLSSGNWVTVTNGIPFFGLQITNPPGTTFFRLH